MFVTSGKHVDEVEAQENKAYTNAKQVRPFANSLANTLKFEFQVCSLLFDDQMFLIPYPREVGHVANSTDNGSAFSLHDFAIREKSEVRILLVIVNFKVHVLLCLLIVKIIIFRLLFDNVVTIRTINAFIDNEIQLLDNNAVGGHSVPL